MLIAATCATLATMLTLAHPGDTVKLTGDCGELVIANRFPRVVTIEASKASVKGLRLTGENITWLGGVLVAPDGMDGFAARGYAVSISGTNIRVAFALVTDAKKGFVIAAPARNVTLDSNKVWRIREDGVIVSGLVNGVIEDNAFSEFMPRPTTCNVGGVITEGLPQRDCLGVWIDGNHADPVQMRDGVTNLRIRRNRAQGAMQSAWGQFGTTGDKPLKNVVIEYNWSQTTGFHSITLEQCDGCAIRGNIVRRGTPGRRSPVRPGTGSVVVCGNEVEGEKADQPCSTGSS